MNFVHKSMKTAAVTLLSVSMMLALAACGSEKKEGAEGAAPNNEPKPAATEPTKTLPPAKAPEEELATLEGDGFVFSYPKAWPEADVSNMPMVVKAYVSPKQIDKFGDNVNIVVEETKATAKQAADAGVAQLSGGAAAEVIKDYKKISYEELPAANGQNAGVLKAEYIQAQLGTPIVSVQQYISTGSKVYTLSVTFSKQSYNDGGEALSKRILESFKVTDTGSSASAPAETGSNTGYNMAEVMKWVTPNIAEDDEQISETTYNYIAAHTDWFPAQGKSLKAAGAAVDSSVTTRHLSKNLKPYLDKMVQVEGEVVEISEESVEGVDMSVIHILDNDDYSVVGIFTGPTDGILDYDVVSMQGVPVRHFSFENVDGGTTNAILMAISSVKKLQ